MSVRSTSALVLGLLLALTGCSGGDGENPAGNPPAQGESPSSGPGYSGYQDYPGQELRYKDGGMAVGLKIKPVESRWLTELAGTPAPPGFHLLAVYVVATGEVSDRPADDAHLNPFDTGLRFGTGDTCERDNIGDRKDPADEPKCHDNAMLSTQFEEVRYQDWPTHDWTELISTGYPIEPGGTRAGVVAFAVRDTFQPGTVLELCPAIDQKIRQSYANCAPVPLPSGTRG